MPFMIWDDKLSVGVEALDGDHKKMIALIDELHEAILAGRSKGDLGDIMAHLVEFTRNHFAQEEKLFARSDYPDAAAHKAEHDELAKWAIQTEIDFHHGTLAAPPLEVLNRMRDWLFDHVNGLDRGYGPHLNAAGIR